MLNSINNISDAPLAAANSITAQKTNPEKEIDETKETDAPAKAARKQDEYVPQKPQPSPGLYRKDGKKDGGEEVIASTDKVDAEIRKLKEKKAKLEQEIALAKDDPKKQEKLQKQLEQVENELRVKDTDSYRRQHMQVTRKQD